MRLFGVAGVIKTVDKLSKRARGQDIAVAQTPKIFALSTFNQSMARLSNAFELRAGRAWLLSTSKILAADVMIHLHTEQIFD